MQKLQAERRRRLDEPEIAAAVGLTPKQVSAQLTSGWRAKHALVHANKRLVFKAAHRFGWEPNFTLEDRVMVRKPSVQLHDNSQQFMPPVCCSNHLQAIIAGIIWDSVIIVEVAILHQRSVGSRSETTKFRKQSKSQGLKSSELKQQLVWDSPTHDLESGVRLQAWRTQQLLMTVGSWHYRLAWRA